MWCSDKHSTIFVHYTMVDILNFKWADLYCDDLGSGNLLTFQQSVERQRENNFKNKNLLDEAFPTIMNFDEYFFHQDMCPMGRWVIKDK